MVAHLLHNQRALLIKGALLFRPNTVVTSVPFSSREVTTTNRVGRIAWRQRARPDVAHMPSRRTPP